MKISTKKQLKEATINKEIFHLKEVHEKLSWFQSWFFPAQFGSALKAYKPETAKLENAWPIYDSYINHTSSFQRWFGNFFSFLKPFTTSPLTQYLDKNKNSLNQGNFITMVLAHSSPVGSQTLAAALDDIDSDDDTPVAKTTLKERIAAIEIDSDDELGINKKTLGELKAALQANSTRLLGEGSDFEDISYPEHCARERAKIHERYVESTRALDDLIPESEDIPYTEYVARERAKNTASLVESTRALDALPITHTSGSAPRASVAALSMFSTPAIVASHDSQVVTGNIKP